MRNALIWLVGYGTLVALGATAFLWLVDLQQEAEWLLGSVILIGCVIWPWLLSWPSERAMFRAEHPTQNHPKTGARIPTVEEWQKARKG